MAELGMVNVSMEFDSQEEREEHPCDICHVSYTTDVVSQDVRKQFIISNVPIPFKGNIFHTVKIMIKMMLKEFVSVY